MDKFLPIPHSTIVLDPILPIEVFEEVINQAHDNAASLRHLSLACKAFHPRARYHLFSSIQIKTVEQLQSSGEFLDSHPWLIPLIGRVVLRVDTEIRHPGRNPREYIFHDAVPVHLLSRLPNLRSWCMGSGRSYIDNAELWLHRRTISCYQRYGVGIQNLEVFCIVLRNSISDFARLVSSFPNLQTLTCSLIHLRTMRGDRPHLSLYGAGIKMPQMAQTLRSLHVGRRVDTLVVEYLLATSASTVTTLTLEIDPDLKDQEDRFNELISKLPRLSFLKLVINALSDGWLEGSNKLLQSIHFTTHTLQHINRACLSDVRVEFILITIAEIGKWIVDDGPVLESCRALEKALLTFKTPGSVLFRRLKQTVDHSLRVARAQFWSPAFEHAFPSLSKNGLLTFKMQCSATKPSSHLLRLGHESRITSLIASNNSKWIATASDDGTIIVWDAELSTIVQEWVAHHGHVVHDLAFSPDSGRLVSAGRGEADNLIVWDVTNGFCKVAALEGHTHNVLICAAWSPDGGLIASGSMDGRVRVWDAQTLQQRSILEDSEAAGSVSWSTNLEFSRDGSYLAQKTSAGICTIWRPLMEEWQPKMPPLNRSGGSVHTNAFSLDADSRRIATAHGDSLYYKEDNLEDYVVRICDVASGAELAVLAGHSRPVVDVSFSPDGRSLLSISRDGRMKIWDTNSWEEIASLQVEEGEESEFWKACFSPDGKYVATASPNGMMRLWRVGDGSCAAVFPEHFVDLEHVVDLEHATFTSIPFTHVAFTPDGKFFASGDSDGIVHIRRISSFTS